MQLLMTILLGLIVFYFYAAITFFNWRGQYQFEETQVLCESLLDCFRMHMDYGYMAFPLWKEQPLP